jgi:hypothetical protein
MGEQVQWTRGRAHFAGGDAQVTGGGGQTAMTEQQLDGTDIGSGFQQMDGEGVS